MGTAEQFAEKALPAQQSYLSG